jgi:hypothetical protein
MAEKLSLWTWLRVPIRAIEAAIDALKEVSMRRHAEGRREEGDQADRHAEDLKKSLRGEEKVP